MKALAVYIRRTQRFPPSKTRKHVLTRGLHQKHYLSLTLSLFLVVMDFSVYSLHFCELLKIMILLTILKIIILIMIIMVLEIESFLECVVCRKSGSP